MITTLTATDPPSSHTSSHTSTHSAPLLGITNSIFPGSPSHALSPSSWLLTPSPRVRAHCLDPRHHSALHLCRPFLLGALPPDSDMPLSAPAHSRPPCFLADHLTTVAHPLAISKCTYRNLIRGLSCRGGRKDLLFSIA
jgi:hypothetical protein